MGWSGFGARGAAALGDDARGAGDAAVLVGVISAVGGGVLVSVLRGEVPQILQPSRPQALLAAAVGGTYLALAGWDANAAYVVSGALGVAVHLVVAQRDVRTRPFSALA